MRVTPKFREKYTRRFLSLLDKFPLRKQAEIQLVEEMRSDGIRVTMRTVRNWMADFST